MIEAFLWSERFATGVASIDTQHRQLFQIINRVGELLIAGDHVAEEALQEVFRELAAYARFHFNDEERVMKEAGVDARFAERHTQSHRQFGEQLSAMWQGHIKMNNPAQTLHGFLVAWLSHHILNVDQAMARQIKRMGAGMSPAAAYDSETAPDEGPTTVLLDALQNLYDLLAQQNRALAHTNQELETRVAERTASLATAYADLSAKHSELTELVSKVDQARNQLLQSEKMAAIGQLAAGVAHEINNPVGFVGSNLGTLGLYVDDLLRVIDAARDYPPAQAVAQAIELPFIRQDLASLLAESREGLERVRTIVANLKDFSHVDQAEWQQADLLAGLESTINVVWHELKYKTEIVRELQPLPPVRCLPAQINQVFMNLLLNAAQAIPEHGTITLRSGLGDRDHGGQVWIEIADDGDGMSEETQRRLFEPFFTTKPVGQGTGLGMSLSWDIMRAHGGRLEVDSAPGAGSRIRLWLPIDGPPPG